MYQTTTNHYVLTISHKTKAVDGSVKTEILLQKVSMLSMHIFEKEILMSASNRHYVDTSA